MAKKEKLAIAGTARGSAGSAKESQAMRSLRIDGSCNGQTLRTRVIKNKKLYNRNFKHKKSFADAGDFPVSQTSPSGSVIPECMHSVATFTLGDFPLLEASLSGSVIPECKHGDVCASLASGASLFYFFLKFFCFYRDFVTII